MLDAGGVRAGLAEPDHREAARRELERVPHLAAPQVQVRAPPRLAAYLHSNWHLAFDEDGIFRHYPELDCCLPRSLVMLSFR